MADYCKRTLFTILRARIFDDDRLNEVLWYVFGKTGLIDHLDLDEGEQDAELP